MDPVLTRPHLFHLPFNSSVVFPLSPHLILICGTFPSLGVFFSLLFMNYVSYPSLGFAPFLLSSLLPFGIITSLV